MKKRAEKGEVRLKFSLVEYQKEDFTFTRLGKTTLTTT